MKIDIYSSYLKPLFTTESTHALRAGQRVGIVFLEPLDPENSTPPSPTHKFLEAIVEVKVLHIEGKPAELVAASIDESNDALISTALQRKLTPVVAA